MKIESVLDICATRVVLTEDSEQSDYALLRLMVPHFDLSGIDFVWYRADAIGFVALSDAEADEAESRYQDFIKGKLQ